MVVWHVECRQPRPRLAVLWLRNVSRTLLNTCCYPTDDDDDELKISEFERKEPML